PYALFKGSKNRLLTEINNKLSIGISFTGQIISEIAPVFSLIDLGRQKFNIYFNICARITILFYNMLPSLCQDSLYILEHVYSLSPKITVRLRGFILPHF